MRKRSSSATAVVVSPSYTRSYPFVMARGQGAAVEDVDGNVFLDCAAGIAVNSTGHSHPAVVAAVVEQAQKFLHMSGTDFYYEPQVRLGEAMNSLAPWQGPKRSFFSNSGTEAIEAAIKLARYSTKRYGIIAFLGSFHGRSLGSLSFTSSKAIQRKGFGPPLAVCITPRFPIRIAAWSGQVLRLLPTRRSRYIEEQILAHLISPDEVAAVVVESIQGEGGYVVPPPEFHQRLRALTSKHGMHLVLDEVQSGMGRTGKMFAIEHFAVEPDIVAVAKGIASGLAARRDDRARRHHDLAAGVACQHVRRQSGGVCRCVGDNRPDQRDRSWRTPRRRRALMNGLRASAGEAAVDRRRARHGADDWHRARARSARRRSARPPSAIGWSTECFKRGLLVLGAGPNTIRLCPPLVMSKAEADTAVRIIDESLSAIA